MYCPGGGLHQCEQVGPVSDAGRIGAMCEILQTAAQLHLCVASDPASPALLEEPVVCYVRRWLWSFIDASSSRHREGSRPPNPGANPRSGRGVGRHTLQYTSPAARTCLRRRSPALPVVMLTLGWYLGPGSTCLAARTDVGKCDRPPVVPACLACLPACLPACLTACPLMTSLMTLSQHQHHHSHRLHLGMMLFWASSPSIYRITAPQSPVESSTPLHLPFCMV
ncbi:hypothetical protein P280DRAFT_140303 [Massarina eburnea CBS 473.64]|uniref:Uncharacterized protein n=1 Tax=Massarina eburnea CBS 473.64 TaxID=1395130 RepID=A0A6A6RQB0_9PLEO|nr:hypothetical protein P280DRAFT_140303 [Massarina eburnea CBS 473.64]